jgi:beta-galactosidase
MGNGPGSLVDYQRILESSERFCGAFVWEWIDHGFRQTDAAGNEFFMHGADVDYRPNGGRYCLDGLLFSDRTPSPGLAELKKAIEPAVIEVGPAGLIVRNRHDVLALDTLAFSWRVEVDGEQRSSGSLDVPPVLAGESLAVPLPAQAGDEPGEWWLTVEARLAEDRLWAAAGHLVAWGQGLLADRPPAATTTALATAAAPAARSRRGTRDLAAIGLIAMGDARFDAASGELVRLGGLDLDGPRVDVYRAPIENDRGQGSANNLAGVWQAVGLDRMQHRTDRVELHGRVLRVTGRSAAATHPHALDYRFEWTWIDGRLNLDVAVEFTGPWADTPYQHREIVPPRLGLRMSLPGGYDTARWFGLGPGESYVDSRAAARVGRFVASVDELQVDYPVPQENGNRLGTRWLQLAGPGLPALRVEGQPTFGFTARRWTSAALERARHPHELADSGRVWLNLDHVQQGLGSAACGPALPERYRIPRTHAEWGIRLSLR